MTNRLSRVSATQVQKLPAIHRNQSFKQNEQESDRILRLAHQSVFTSSGAKAREIDRADGTDVRGI